MERIKSVPGSNGNYMCTDTGDLYAPTRTIIDKRGRVYIKKAKKLKPYLDAEGYRMVQLQINGKRKWLKMHRIVAELFVGDYTSDLSINHIDFNKLNNTYSNLVCVSQKENVSHSAKAGRLKNNTSHFKKLPWRKKHITNQFDLNGNFIRSHSSLAEAAIFMRGTKSMISRAIVGRSKTAYGYKWKYEI